MQVRFRVMVSEYAAAGLLTELGASSADLQMVGESKAIERECPMAEFERLLSRGLVGARDFVDVGQGWEPVATCPRFSKVCQAMQRTPETAGWILGGLAAAAAAVALLHLVWR